MSHLPIPRKLHNAHCVVLGKTGSGKSSLLRVNVEDLLDQGKRVVVVDPKGDWWGLKVGADGKSPGYPVILFGDFKEGGKTDVPINEHSGRQVAELITSGNRPCVIGFRGWMPGKMTKFWIDFAATLFNTSAGELYVIIDECHNFMPKGKVLDPLAGQCLHWSNRLLSEGRGLGLIFLLASQRPQKVHNDSLTCCETLFAMRVAHAADRGATKDWIDGCGDSKQGVSVLNELAGLKRGEAFVWSPENEFGPKKIQFPMFRTFDSFAPPQLQKKVSNSSWADVDIEEVKIVLADAVKEAAENDPKILRRQIADLEKRVAHHEKKPDGPPPTDKVSARELTKLRSQLEIAMQFIAKIEAHGFENVNPEEVKAALDAGMEKATAMIEQRLSARQKEFERLKTDANRVLRQLKALVGDDVNVVVHVQHNKPFSVAATRPTPPQPAEPVDAGDWKPSKCATALITALLQYFPKALSKNRVALLSGYSVTSSTFQNGMSELRVNACIHGTGDNIVATDKARGIFLNWTPLPTGEKMREYWVNKIGGCPGALLKKLIEVYPDAMTKQDLGDSTTPQYSPTSSTFQNALSTLRTLELITRDPNPSAHPDLFLE